MGNVLGLRAKATIKDVAQAADVGIGTASRALNDHPNVLPATRDRVREAARRLGYVPDRAAQSLRTGRTGVVGCILSFGYHPVAGAFISGIERVLRPAGYTVVFGNSVDRQENETHLLSFFGMNRVDGLITNLARDDGPDLIPQLRSLGVPVVLFERNLNDAFDAVLTDQGGGAYDATSYLLSQGHSRIAMAVGSVQSLPGRARHAAFLRAHADCGRAAHSSLIIDMVSPADFGLAEGLALLRRKSRPTAVIVGAHELIGLLAAVNTLGMSIPGDLSVICFGGTPLADLLDPPLTFVGWDGAEHGRLAAEILVRRMAGGNDAAERILIPTQLVKRGSCMRAKEENSSILKKRTKKFL